MTTDFHEKPEAPIIGADSNIYNILGIASKALKKAGQPELAKEMIAKATSAGSYDAALAVIMEYVEPTEA